MQHTDAQRACDAEDAEAATGDRVAVGQSEEMLDLEQKWCVMLPDWLREMVELVTCYFSSDFLTDDLQIADPRGEA